METFCNGLGGHEENNEGGMGKRKGVDERTAKESRGWGMRGGGVGGGYYERRDYERYGGVDVNEKPYIYSPLFTSLCCLDCTTVLNCHWGLEITFSPTYHPYPDRERQNRGTLPSGLSLKLSSEDI
jgi:hypothetical protein